mmetsp:Transcript_49701/g.115257  ORF Transcript_49701/g.115257 Transcript_49701/m.115257 type:complete len:215 (+) Transcript_49701:233-877(+)
MRYHTWPLSRHWSPSCRQRRRKRLANPTTRVQQGTELISSARSCGSASSLSSRQTMAGRSPSPGAFQREHWVTRRAGACGRTMHDSSGCRRRKRHWKSTTQQRRISWPRSCWSEIHCSESLTSSRAADRRNPIALGLCSMLNVPFLAPLVCRPTRLSLLSRRAPIRSVCSLMAAPSFWRDTSPGMSTPSPTTSRLYFQWREQCRVLLCWRYSVL